jgi:glutaminyl-tRNA synthetase
MSNDNKNKAAAETAAPVSNFLRAIIDNDNAAGTYKRDGMPTVITRFPPEPMATCTSATPNRSASTSV